MTVEATTARARKFPEDTHGFEFDGCKKQWNLGTPVSIVRMVKIRRIENIGGNMNL